MKVTLVCKLCGKQFQVFPYRAETALYCSYSCRSKVPKKKNRKIMKVCEHCGKTYLTYPCFSESHYCSNSCAHSEHGHKISGDKSYMWKGGPKNKICPYCGNSFQVHPGDKIRKYCSKKCFDAVRVNRVILTCMNCGKQYIEQASKANRGSHTFCSLKCRDLFMIGENSPQWLGGISKEPYTWEFNKRLKKAIRERDNYTCAICQKHGTDIHHIDYNKKNAAPQNLVTLCHSYHSKTSHNRSYWIEYFSI